MSDARIPPSPQFCEPVPPHHRNDATLKLLAERRSTVAKNMTAPGPNAEQIDDLIRIATRVPDHGKIAPWRFILFQGEAREQFGGILRKVCAAANPDAPEDLLAFEAARFTRAPLVICVVSHVLERHKIPTWEQELSSGAVGQQLLIAASAMGFAAQWLTEWYAYDPHVKDALGLRSGERVAGFIYIGTATEDPLERVRPDHRALITHWPG